MESVEIIRRNKRSFKDDIEFILDNEIVSYSIEPEIKNEDGELSYGDYITYTLIVKRRSS